MKRSGCAFVILHLEIKQNCKIVMIYVLHFVKIRMKQRKCVFSLKEEAILYNDVITLCIKGHDQNAQVSSVRKKQ